MGPSQNRRSKQARLSLNPLPDAAALSHDRLATNEHSQVASVRYEAASAHRLGSKPSARPRSTRVRHRRQGLQGSLDMAFARAASRIAGAAEDDQRVSEVETLQLPTELTAVSQTQRTAPSENAPVLTNEDSESSDSASSSSEEAVSRLKRVRNRDAFTAKENATAIFHSSNSYPLGPIESPRGQSKEQPKPGNSIFGVSPSNRRATHASNGDRSPVSATPSRRENVRSSTRVSRSQNKAQDSEVRSQRGIRQSSRINRRASPASGDSPVLPQENEDSSTDAAGLSQGTSERSPAPGADALISDNQPPSRLRRLVRGHRATNHSKVVSDSDEDFGRTRRKGQALVDSTELVDSSSESEAILSSARRKKRRRSPSDSPSVKISEQKREQEKADLDDDLEFLRASSPPPGQGRSKKRSAKDERRRLLERMKARRADKGAALSDDDDDDEDVQQELDLDLAHDNEDIDDFVIENDTNDEAEHMVEIPLELTAMAHKTLKEYFRDVVEWMVHNKLNPAFPRDDQLYRLAFRKVTDEVQGYALSKFMSSTWRPDFSRAVQARPIFNEEPLIGAAFFHEHCAACGRTSHPAKYVVTFTGKAYDLATLENLKEDDGTDESSDDDDDDDDASSANDTQSLDANGHALPPESHRFFVGRFCKDNSERAHALTHWRWHLNSWIMDWLRHEGYMEAERVLEREQWSTKKRTRYANRVMDDLAERELRNLWRDFKIQQETAKEQKTYGRGRAYEH